MTSDDTHPTADELLGEAMSLHELRRQGVYPGHRLRVLRDRYEEYRARREAGEPSPGIYTRGSEPVTRAELDAERQDIRRELARLLIMLMSPYQERRRASLAEILERWRVGEDARGPQGAEGYDCRDGEAPQPFRRVYGEVMGQPLYVRCSQEDAERVSETIKEPFASLVELDLLGQSARGPQEHGA